MQQLRRRRYIINKTFQFRVIAISVGYCVLGLAIMGALLFTPLILEVRETAPYSYIAADAATVALYLHGRFWPAFAICILAVVLHATLISHRIAGPLYRLQRVLSTVRDGILPGRFSVRKKDFFKDQIDTANQMVHALRSRVGEIQRANEALQLSIGEAKTAVAANPSTDLQRLIQNVEAHSHRLNDAVAGFRIEDAEGIPEAKVTRESALAPGTRRGFSLLEVLIVVALILTLSAIALPRYQTFLAKVKGIKAVADMKQVAEEIDAYFLKHGVYPQSLADVGLAAKKDPWGNPYQYLRHEGNRTRGSARKDHNLVPINSDYDLYSRGPDGRSASPLTAAISRDDIVRANNGGYYGLAADY